MFPRHPDFDRLELAFGTIGRPEIDERSIRVKVRHLSVYKGFPGYDQEKLYKEATVVFEDVVSSRREFHEYVPLEQVSKKRGAIRGFKGGPYTIVDGPFAEVNKPVFSIYYGGISHDPEAWVEWDIVAASVRVEDGVEY